MVEIIGNASIDGITGSYGGNGGNSSVAGGGAGTGVNEGRSGGAGGTGAGGSAPGGAGGTKDNDITGKSGSAPNFGVPGGIIHGAGGGGGGATGKGGASPSYNPATGSGGGGGGGAGSPGNEATGFDGSEGDDGSQNDGSSGNTGGLNPNSIATTKFPLASRQGTKSAVINNAMYGKPGIAGTDGTINPGLSGQVANITSFNDIVINPFSSYEVNVPDGGYITIRWYAQ